MSFKPPTKTPTSLPMTMFSVVEKDIV